MMNSLTLYEKNKHLLRTGDLVVFYGNSPLSWLIRLFADGPSHIAPVRQGWHTSAPEVTICESTIEKRNGKTFNGVQTNPLAWRIQNYGGSVAAVRLRSDVRNLFNWQHYYAFIGKCQDSVRYDVLGLPEFLLREIPIAGVRLGQTEHKNLMVCSAWNCALFQMSSPFLRNMNWSLVTPLNILQANLFEPEVIPLLGKVPKIPHYNEY